ncbi:MAG TPA: tRNA uridine-5-carboxymethylaminomethyl(34) synthesis GTPase MnmE, partial [Blastocatellia bacterium]|nr:tRNA uridine-5-carboxymethylaminomethyl(34) synthesis GTPase MnmE [Blastocatellia bacterium]
MLLGDTIAAISTPPGRGGVGVVRLSGPAALEIAAAIFQTESQIPVGESARARFGRLVDPTTGEHIDESILTYFKAPHSYTGEDVVELSCHGSPIVVSRVLDLILQRGARIGEPGEFTFRAFSNRRIDLAQAQAVRDLIDAQTRYQARVATRQLEGALSKRLVRLKDLVVEIIVHLESSVEFAEDDISTDAESDLLSKINAAVADLSEIAASFSFGRFVKEGFALAIVGRPNVGKSSVFNRLAGSDRAIVTEIPGTTRDALYESASIAGLPVRLIDTAGIRETTDVVETIGISRSRAAIADADIALLVMDASQPMTVDDSRLLEQVPGERRIIAMNKIDLPRAIESLPEDSINISALTGEGFDRLTASLLHRLSGGPVVERDDLMITDARQHDAVRRSIEQLEGARELMVQGEFEEIILLRLRGA